MEFDRNDREAIEAAIGDTDPTNPIARAAAERIEQFVANLERQAKRNGRWPTSFLLYRPETAFDEIVIQLTLEAVAEELSYPIEVHWVPTPPRS